MSLNRRNPKRDANEMDVIDALQKCGWMVRRVSADGWPDLFCFRWHEHPTRAEMVCRTRWVEVKQPKKKLRASQQWWEGVLPVAVLRSVQEVLEWNQQQN